MYVKSTRVRRHASMCRIYAHGRGGVLWYHGKEYVAGAWKLCIVRCAEAGPCDSLYLELIMTET